MFDFIKNIEKWESLKRIYDNDLFTVKSISQQIGIWDNLTLEEKETLENNTPLESYINSGRELDISGDEQFTKLGYGEITKEGVELLYDFIKSKVDDESNINFCDIGSGNGKLVLHLSLISNFNKIIGIELHKIRHLYSNWILENSLLNINNVEFINCDALDYDFNNINFVFMNDLLFERKDIDLIISKFKPGTHLISIEENSLEKKDTVYLNPSWMKQKLPFKYYKI
jgi:precorrin-6B methylase 2